jgi:DNA primase catalytic subunit
MENTVINEEFWEKAADAWGRPLAIRQQEQEKKIHQIAAKSVDKAIKSVEKHETKKTIGTALEAIWSDDEDDEFI